MSQRHGLTSTSDDVPGARIQGTSGTSGTSPVSKHMVGSGFTLSIAALACWLRGAALASFEAFVGEVIWAGITACIGDKKGWLEDDEF